MKFGIKTICLLIVCLTLSSCDFWGDYIYYSMTPNPNTIEVDDVNVFFDETYVEYVGGQDAKAFFNKHARVDKYREIAFHYRYTDDVVSNTVGIILKPSIFVLDVYYESYDFSVNTFEILPHTNMAGEMPSQIFDDGFWCVTRVIDDSFNKDNLCCVMFDEKHNTMRYVFIYGFYSEDFRAQTEPFSPGDDDYKIKDVTETLLPQLKWNTMSPYNSNDPYDWIFDYYKKYFENAEESTEESTEEPTEAIYYIFADISECEKLLSYENTNNQKVIKQLTPKNDEKLKKLPYNQYFAIEYKSDTLYYQIYAYEFYNSDDALNYFVNVTGRTSDHDVLFLETGGSFTYNIIVAIENKAYRITTSRKHENEIKRMLGNVFSLEYII